MPLQFDKKYLTKKQKKLAEKVIKEVLKFSNLKILSYTVFGLNPFLLIEELKEKARGKSKREIKSIENKIKNVESNINEFVMVVFTFQDPLKKLVFLRTRKPIKRTPGFYYIWTGLLDFPIPLPIIFGRACKKPQHGGGIYYFAPIKYKLGIEFKNHQNRYESIEQFLFGFIQEDPFIRELERIRWHLHAKNEMKAIFHAIKSKLLTGNDIIDKLNSNKNLLNYMKLIKHFGTQQILYQKFVSEVDVSTICVPCENITILQIENYDSSHRNSLQAIFALTDVFIKLL